MDQGLNLKQKIVVVVMDILILVELMVSIYFGYQSKENITAVFLKMYVPAVIATIIIGRLFIRRLRSNEATV